MGRRTAVFLLANPSPEFLLYRLLSQLFSSALLAQHDHPDFSGLSMSERVDAAAATCKYCINLREDVARVAP